MNTAEVIVAAYNSRKNYRDKEGNNNWAAWAHDYPSYSRVLAAAEQALEEFDNG